MKYLKKYNISESSKFEDNNEVFYTIQDILLDFLDDNHIPPLPNEDEVSSYEYYLSENGEPQSYGYYLDSDSGFKASNTYSDKKIKSFALWNLTRVKIDKLIEYVDSERDRIKQATGHYVGINIEQMENDRYDAYITIVSDDEYEKKVRETNINNYIKKLNYIEDKISKLPQDKDEEVFGLIDKLFNIVK
jgi:hypothetical protein